MPFPAGAGGGSDTGMVILLIFAGYQVVLCMRKGLERERERVGE